MARWSEFAAAEPEFARQVRVYFPVSTYGTLATLRRDGSPRINGSYVVFTGGDLWIYAMPGSVRVVDLRRDPRLALHSPTATELNDDWRSWPGDVKIAGYGIEAAIDSDINIEWDVDLEMTGSHIDMNEIARANSIMNESVRVDSLIGFRIDVNEVVHTYYAQADCLAIESWHEGRGLRRREQHYPDKTRVDNNFHGRQKNEV